MLKFDNSEMAFSHADMKDTPNELKKSNLDQPKPAAFTTTDFKKTAGTSMYPKIRGVSVIFWLHSYRRYYKKLATKKKQINKYYMYLVWCFCITYFVNTKIFYPIHS